MQEGQSTARRTSKRLSISSNAHSPSKDPAKGNKSRTGNTTPEVGKPSLPLPKALDSELNANPYDGLNQRAPADPEDSQPHKGSDAGVPVSSIGNQPPPESAPLVDSSHGDPRSRRESFRSPSSGDRTCEDPSTTSMNNGSLSPPQPKRETLDRGLPVTQPAQSHLPSGQATTRFHNETGVRPQPDHSYDMNRRSGSKQDESGNAHVGPDKADYGPRADNDTEAHRKQQIGTGDSNPPTNAVLYVSSAYLTIQISSRSYRFVNTDAGAGKSLVSYKSQIARLPLTNSSRFLVVLLESTPLV